VTNIEIALLFRALRLLVLTFCSSEYVSHYDDGLTGQLDATIAARTLAAQTGPKG